MLETIRFIELFQFNLVTNCHQKSPTKDSVINIAVICPGFQHHTEFSQAINSEENFWSASNISVACDLAWTLL